MPIPAPLTLELPRLERSASLRAESANLQARTVDLVWTTGAPVLRPRFLDDPILETLSLDPGAVRLERLNGGAPFLASHDARSLASVLGVVVEGSARIEQGQGVATVRFSDRAEVEPIFRDIANGILRNVSVGYRVHRYQISKRDGAPEDWRAVDWEPLEISAVAIGADPGATVRAAESGDAPLYPCVLIRQDESPAPGAATPKGAPMPETTPAAIVEDTARTAAPIETRAAPAAPVTAPAAPAPSAPDPAAIRAEERSRVAEIMALCTRHGIEATVSGDLIARGVTLDAARAAVLDALVDRDPFGGRVNEPSFAQARGSEAGEIAYRDAMTEALLHRHNPAAHPLPDRAREFRGLNLMELARHALERRGTPTRGLAKMDLARAAFATRDGGGYHSTSDFAAILANVANKTLRQAYDGTARTFTTWARSATIMDFKPVQRTQLGGAPDLQQVLESGEVHFGTIGEGKEVYALATYGRIVAITRQTLINDDLNAFTRVPAAFGASAADLESDIVYAILTQNPTMADGTALFDAAHGNLGTASVVSEAALAAAYRMFGQQRGLEARLISILPRYILVPPGSRSVEARKQITATTPANTAGVNTFAGRLEVIEEPRLIPTAGQDPWFLAADPARIDTVEYAYLDGQQGVYTETRAGFEVDGLEIKARHDFAAKAIDWRGLLKNPGAAA